MISFEDFLCLDRAVTNSACQNHRMVWVGRELIDHLVPTPLPLDRVTQSPIQLGLEHCQGGGFHNFSGQPVPVPHHTHGEEFLISSLNL